MASRPLTRHGAVAAALAAYAALSLAAGAVVAVARPDLFEDRTGYALMSAFCLLQAVLAVTLVARLPRHPVTATLAVAVGLTLLSRGAEPVANAAGARAAAETFANLGWLGTVPFLPPLFLFFDGWPAGRWRAVAWLDVVALATLVPLSAGLRPEPVGSVVAGGCAAVLLATGVVAGARLGVRTVRRRDREAGVSSFGAAAALAVLVFVLGDVVGLRMTGLVFGLVVYGPSIAIGYGVLRHRLFGLDVAVRRVVVAATVTLLLGAAYAGTAYAAANALGVPRPALVAALVPALLIATALAPAYRAANRLAERQLYGDRRDPWLVLRRLGADLAATSPEDVPAVVAQRTRDGLRLPWVAIELDREGSLVEVAAAGMRQVQPVQAFELRHAGARVGRLLVQPRRGQPGLDRRDRQALAQVAVDVSAAVSAARLVDELTESRERLVAGREAERAWLRRELHDGLGPSLAGMSLALDSARRRLGPVPDDAALLLGTVQDEAARAWSSVRELLSDLRPAGLDELGLVGAIEDVAHRLERPDDFDVAVVVDGATGLPPLPAAVEVAAYRIVSEAMTNAARHSAGHHCRVELRAGSRLDIVVADDGAGVPGSPGIGMRSMAERAADVGGTIRVERATGHGTTVRVQIPLVAAP